MLTFDPTTHEYGWNGRPVISVTQAIKEAGIIDDRWFNQEATLLGTYVHEATALDDRGELDESTLDERIVPYVRAWRAAKAAVGLSFNPGDIETFAYHPVYDFAGTIDRIATLGLRGVVVEIKTGEPADWHRLQTASYLSLARGCRQPRYAIYLRDDGDYRVETHTDPKDFDIFLAALTVAKYKRIHQC